MKKLLLLLSIFTTLTAKAQTSVYHPFPDSNAVWNVTIQYLRGCYTINPVSYTFSYTFSGDTTINSKTYHKLVIPYVQDLDTSCYGAWIKAGYQGCISQDTASRKVYAIWPNDTTQEILYDFSLKVGDKFYPPGSCTQTGDVDSVSTIDSILIGTDYRKRWNGWYGFAPYIEGIGFTYGLLIPCSGYDLGPYFTLTCFSQNGLTIYPNADSSCNAILSVKDILQPNISVKISPNPATNQLTIRTSYNHSNEATTISIMNILGEMIQEERTPWSNDISINIKNLSAGIYFLQLKSESGNAVKKFIKQ